MKNLHNTIMNLPCEIDLSSTIWEITARQQGHRDARHAAAELCAGAESYVEELESALKMLLNALPINRDWLDPDIERFANGLIKKSGEKK